VSLHDAHGTDTLPAARRPARLLVVAAHPGDAERGIGGSVTGWTAEGTIAHLVCCTSGDAGADDPGLDPLELAATREAEQRSAAAIVGFEAVTFLHRPHGALVNDLALREQLARLVRAFRPDTVAAPDPRALFPSAGGVNHVDRREAGTAAADTASSVAPDAMAFPHLASHEGLQPHRVEHLYLFDTERPTAVVDIAATFEVKLRALAEHASGDPQRWAARTEAAARRDGSRAGRELAEILAVVKLD
jgi:LmbE family N-acetylglucosaminyl deacetylase